MVLDCIKNLNARRQVEGLVEELKSLSYIEGIVIFGSSVVMESIHDIDLAILFNSDAYTGPEDFSFDCYPDLLEAIQKYSASPYPMDICYTTEGILSRRAALIPYYKSILDFGVKLF